MKRTTIALCLTLAACGGDDDFSGTTYFDAAIDAQLTADPALDGTWEVRACADDFVETVMITGSTVQSRLRLFAEINCLDMALTQTTTETYVLAGASTTAPGATNIDYTMVTLTATPHLQEIVDQFNTSSYCEVSTWAVGVATDITGRTCSGANGTFTVPAAGSVRYDLYKVETTRLYVGDTATGEGTSAATRPTTVGPYYTKV